MRFSNHKPAALALLATLALPGWSSLPAQTVEGSDPDITVDGVRPLDPAQMAEGPEVKGIISARSGDRLQITSADGNNTTVTLGEATRIKASSGLFGGGDAPGRQALLNGLPVTVKTLQAGDGLLASQIRLRKADLKTANMIHVGTNQRFEEQAAATEALRGRMGDIDKYNIKSTTNVYFDTGKAALSPEARANLCNTAATAENMDNALMLVVGYTDSVGSEEYNQALSERRAASVINYLQQACRWKPYRMLTPTGMAEADPAASNDTPDGKAQNRRVSVNVLVSKGLDGI